jgi:hypothetical protein
VSIFRVEKSVSEEPADCHLLTLTDFSTMKMEVIRSSETSVHIGYTWWHTPEDGILNMAVFRVIKLMRHVGSNRGCEDGWE